MIPITNVQCPIPIVLTPTYLIKVEKDNNIQFTHFIKSKEEPILLLSSDNYPISS